MFYFTKYSMHVMRSRLNVTSCTRSIPDFVHSHQQTFNKKISKLLGSVWIPIFLKPHLAHALLFSYVMGLSDLVKMGHSVCVCVCVCVTHTLYIYIYACMDASIYILL